jgi:hypothetical protein
VRCTEITFLFTDITNMPNDIRNKSSYLILLVLVFDEEFLCFLNI